MAEKRGPGRPTAAVRDNLFPVRLTAEELEAFRRAAEDRGLTVSAWIRMVCLEAARRDER